MSQLSKETIIQADVILQPQLFGIDQSSTQKGTNQTEAELYSSQKKKLDELINSSKQKTIQSSEKRNQKRNQRIMQIDTITQPKVKSQKQNQILRKIKAVKDKLIKSEQRFLEDQETQSKIQLVYKKKRLPSPLKSQSSDIEEDEKNLRAKSKKVTINYKDQVIANFRKNKYRKKNYNFQNKITKMADIKISQKSINIKGQIIFVWQKQVINQKWAKTQMICLQLHDESGTAIVAIPQKCMITNSWQFQIGKYVQLQRVSVRQKYPQRVWVLVHQKSKLKITNKADVPKQLIIQPQKLGITISEIQSEPSGRTCNLVCLILQKSQNQFFRNGKGQDLTISKIVAYDPIDNKSIVIKLWEDKAHLRFYTNSVVYLLRGVEIKDFKGVRQYHASKEFNMRCLTFSRIQQHLQLVIQQRWKRLKQTPHRIQILTINQCIRNLRLQIKKRKKPEPQKKQLGDEVSGKIMSMSERVAGQNQQSKTDEVAKDKILICWSVCEVRIIGIQIKSNYPIKFSQCIRCNSKTMIDCYVKAKCSICESQKSKFLYWIKCQFYDGSENFLGQLSERAAGKMFSMEDVPMKLQFFETTNLNFKKQIQKQLIGDAVRAIIATTKQQIYENVWVTGHYIMDILPFEDDISQQSNHRQESDGGNQSVSKIISLMR